jgi:peptidoglycan DL-endopeptidase CwlO
MRILWILSGLFGLLLLTSSCGTTSRMASPQSGVSEEQHQEIIQLARSKLGSRYQYGATGPRRFDCSGFTWYVFQNTGVDIGRTTTMQAQAGQRIRPSGSRPGDLVFFGKGRKMQHVGIVVSNNGSGLEVIHASSSRGVIIEDVYASPYWSERIKFAVRPNS